MELQGCVYDLAWGCPHCDGDAVYLRRYPGAAAHMRKLERVARQVNPFHPSRPGTSSRPDAADAGARTAFINSLLSMT